MPKSLLAALCFALTAWHVPGATSVFVTAGFPVYPPPALFVTPDLMWTNMPVGQEFVSAVPRIDFVEVHFGAGATAHHQIVLHEQTITGPVIAVSETVLRDFTSSDMTRFHFSPPVTVSPGARYVLEFVRREPITSVENSPEIYRPGGDYIGGDRIWQGVPQAGRDLYFRAGVFVPSIFSSNYTAIIADGVARYFDPTATFDNPFVTNFDGATLKWDLSSGSAAISLASGGGAEISIAAETGDISHIGGATSFARLLTNEWSSNSIEVQFNASADAGAVGAVLRSLLLTAPERVPMPSPFPPILSLSRLQLTFTHSFGEATDSRVFFVGRPNTPPPTRVFVTGAGAGAFLSGGPVFITRLRHPTVSVECNLGTLNDDDGDPLTFVWSRRSDGAVVSTLPRFTNDYAPGLHWVDARVSDGKITVNAETAFEVIAPNEALTRLRADLAQRDLGNNKRRLERPLRFAAYAIRHQQWILAARQLEIFRQRLGRNVEDEELYGRWYDAAGDIKYAVAPRRRYFINPPGVFPGPGIPVPQPR